jgi:predicted site-specific integrase-resolvase
MVDFVEVAIKTFLGISARPNRVYANLTPRAWRFLRQNRVRFLFIDMRQTMSKSLTGQFEEIARMTPAKRGGKRVGYVRVSSIDQNAERQLDGAELDRRFTDKASGKDTKRTQLQAALDYLRDGDVLVIHSMDRLARNLDDLRKIVTDFTGRGVTVEFEKERLTFTGDDNAMSKLLLSVMGAFAEFERVLSKNVKGKASRLQRETVYTGVASLCWALSA